ncbi:PLP-dependent aminotransferase family protein [Pseudomonas tolaasii]|uniref:MocR-like pyridoxine biosynthesis transcription factor PdxR n=1 Tax=Pseudomonas tolaasii TaxID=29442 RepID=UPI0015A3FED1|nr:PLP-dependent aminotransferase family protein [Pseudomonas tolaasii]NVZ46029.1 PLP-dependent aminotransferase family protein [Pseudomonas tolaasii]NWA49955.1 PLP-dependent aminotransferase family protein [Pseudomonas tolaasii]
MSSLPKYQEIYRRFRQAIDQGQLGPGDRVPSVRGLALELKVARGTVEAAYQLLVSEGFFEARGQAGTVIAGSAPQVTVKPLPVAAPASKGPRPLQMGLPALDAFPRKLWARLVTRQVRRTDADSLAMGDVRGALPLRVAIANYLALYRGVECSPQQVFVCSGYAGSLTLLCEALQMTGQRCWFEDPGYLHARQLLSHQGVELVPVPVDADGLQVDQGRQCELNARLAIVTPAHQSPLGVALSPARRLALLDWAREQGSWVVEDDYDSEFRYRGQPLAALKSQDLDDRVIYAGSFSKMLFPGLRLGYLVVPAALLEAFERGALALQQRSAQLLQLTAADFLEQGHFTRHLKKMRQLYALRRGLLVDALREHCAQLLRVDEQAGGINLLARLLVDVPDRVVADAAMGAGLAVQALSGWTVEPGQGEGLLMGFTNVATAAEAVAIALILRGAVLGCISVAAVTTCPR